ncbi:lysophospholipid acyltransferase family protein [Mucilaginibacter sp. OK283]|jgi:KDO2-lipid IV(A) lauroyltransferase|uniref:lysophospholipid acyltransferase family protein n=1 Tax=Mucilaginibacter sp. OK283 TaxID=1881049 RepID=UPI0008C7DDEF|nr:lysophospholipid acyltransferase family protein [Mucilaginibacter sp. OK283]SEO81958.1 KDO2-lipid IV(A) lauroyltransferase [Mucilaginibacter sp. OK283]
MVKKGLIRLGILFLYLTSLLPFWFLYLISDVLFVIIYHIVHYRRAVVQQNLANAFPEKTEKERHDIERKYYHYLADLIVETVKMITVSEKQIQKRVVATNAQLVHEYFAKGKSIIAVAGHYCNWEMAALNFNFVTDKRFMIVYKPLNNEIFNDFFIQIRSRFGGQPIAMKQTMRKMVEYRKELTVSVLVGDQTPGVNEVNYFTTFLNQPTAVFLGIEKISKTIDAAVVFYDMKRVKRGYYTYTLVPLTENPKQTAEHELTEMHVQYLEGMIRKEPQYWLWSHRRWKFKPEDKHK